MVFLAAHFFALGSFVVCRSASVPPVEGRPPGPAPQAAPPRPRPPGPPPHPGRTGCVPPGGERGGAGGRTAEALGDTARKRRPPATHHHPPQGSSSSRYGEGQDGRHCILPRSLRSEAGMVWIYICIYILCIHIYTSIQDGQSPPHPWLRGTLTHIRLPCFHGNMSSAPLHVCQATPAGDICILYAYKT